MLSLFGASVSEGVAFELGLEGCTEFHRGGGWGGGWGGVLLKEGLQAAA